MIKKLLGILVFSLLLISFNANATVLICKVDKAFKCEDNGCNELNSEIYINIDTLEDTYQKTDSKGTKTYDLHIYKSGTFVIAEVGESTIFKMDTKNNKNFVEITYQELVAYNNFGICKFK